MSLFPPQFFRRTEGIHRIGLAAAKPAATDVLVGTLYFSTDLLTLERSDGSTWASYSVAGGAPGPTGATGPQGLIGSIGDSGEDGLDGFPIVGPQGIPGSSAGQLYTKGITVDGGSSVLTTGVKGYVSIPVSGNIVSWRLLANIAGDVEFDVLLDAFGSYPPITSIVASAPPELVGVDSDEDSTLTGWTIAVVTGDVLGFEIVGVPATITRVTLELDIQP